MSDLEPGTPRPKKKIPRSLRFLFQRHYFSITFCLTFKVAKRPMMVVLCKIFRETKGDRRMARRTVRRLSLSLKRDEALSATRVSIGKNSLVYLLIADKKLVYPEGKSRIAYIGTTRNGLDRIAQSIAARADQILNLHGVRAFHARIVTCRPRRRVRTWIKLERALLILFREMFDDIPHCNRNGRKMKRTDEFQYFAESGVRNVIEELS